MHMDRKISRAARLKCKPFHYTPLAPCASRIYGLATNRRDAELLAYLDYLHIKTTNTVKQIFAYHIFFSFSLIIGRLGMFFQALLFSPSAYRSPLPDFLSLRHLAWSQLATLCRSSIQQALGRPALRLPRSSLHSRTRLLRRPSVLRQT